MLRKPIWLNQNLCDVKDCKKPAKKSQWITEIIHGEEDNTVSVNSGH